MKNKLKIILITFFISSAWSPSFAFAPESLAVGIKSESVDAEIKHALNNWVNALSEKSSQKILSLYENDAILLPTLSPKILNTPELRKAYFDKLMSNSNLKVVIDNLSIKVFDDVAIASGLYTFSHEIFGKKTSVEARFSFVYHKTRNGWLIVNQHSSKLPS